ITIGGRNMRLHYIQFMDGFSVEPIPGGLRDRLGARESHHLADNLARQLNGGNTFLQAYSLYLEQKQAVPFVQESVIKTLLDRINSNAFPVSLQDFSCSEEHLNCPIT
ncbi:T3SS effector NleG family protein, partial [Escherichia albertii]|nr:T3SS effector NleG family protein [Escherichia albertii]